MTQPPDPRRDDPAFDAFLRDAAQLSQPSLARQGIAPGTLLAGKFRVERCIGLGGMGAVYAVRHELTRHRRALKLLHAERLNNTELVRRFLDEASAAGRAGSDHLVETFDAGTLPSGEPYLVMELLSGLTIRDYVTRHGKLAPQVACELVAQAAEGIAAAHRARIIHRDLKPDNLFIVERDGKAFVKVLDFGISKFSSDSLVNKGGTEAGMVFGTPAYMAPEQFMSARDADERADVFALGAVLFECLAGESPYDAPTVPAIGARLMLGQYTPLPSLRDDLDVRLVDLVHRAIAADPNARIASARALIEELAPFRDELGAGALPQTANSSDHVSVLPGPGRSFVKRVLGALALAATLGLAAWWLSRAEEARPSAVPRPPVRVPIPSPPSLAIRREAEPATPDAAVPEPAVPSPARRTQRREAAGVQATDSKKPPKNQLGLVEDNPFR